MRPRLIDDDRLLDSALAAFADLGYEGTSVRALCRHLGMSHNLLHARFGSKEALWFAAVDHGFQDLLAELMTAAYKTAGGDELDQLRAVMLCYVEVILARPALLQVVNHEASRPGPRFDYMFATYIGPAHQAVDSLLKKLQRAGRIRPGPVSTIYYFLVTHGLGAVPGLPSLAGRLGDADAPPAEVARLAVDLVLDGLAADRSQRVEA